MIENLSNVYTNGKGPGDDRNCAGVADIGGNVTGGVTTYPSLSSIRLSRALGSEWVNKGL